MRTVRTTYVKLTLHNWEKAAYQSAADKTAQTMSEWIRLALREKLTAMGMKHQLIAPPPEPAKHGAAMMRAPSPDARIDYNFEPNTLDPHMGLGRENRRRRAEGLEPLTLEQHLASLRNGRNES